MNVHTSDPSPNLAPRPARPLLRVWFWWLVGGLVVGCIGFVVLLNLLNRQKLLTRDRLDAARLRWKRADIRDYDLSVTVRNNETMRYELQVRKGNLAHATLNDRPLEPRKAQFWTIDGLLDDIFERELAAESRPGMPPCYSLVDFDPETGQPVRFLRHGDGQTTVVELRLVRTTAAPRQPQESGPTQP